MNRDYDQIKKYIEADIDPELRLLISDFALLWNNYENALFSDEYGNPHYDFYKLAGKEYSFEENINDSRIKDVRLINVINERKNEEFDKKVSALYSRFKMYYYDRHGRMPLDYNDVINNYNIRRNDILAWNLNQLLLGADAGNVERMYLLIMLIVGRVRNNMFHGLKSIKDLNKQVELFRICNEALTLTLEVMHKNKFTEGRGINE